MHCHMYCLAAEEEILKQYESDSLFSEEALCAALNTLATEDVICPICQKYVLAYVCTDVSTVHLCRESMQYAA